MSRCSGPLGGARLAAWTVSVLLLGLAARSSSAGPPRADWGMTAARSEARAWIGVGVTELDGGASSLPAGPGVTLARVTADGPAAKAGLIVGDVLLAVDGQVLEGAAGLRAALAGRRPGETATAVVLREGRALTREIVLGAAPETPAIRRAVPLVQVAPALPSPPPSQAPRVASARPAAPAEPAALPATLALTYMGETPRASLGLETMELEPGLARFFGSAGTPGGHGVLVASVGEASAAAKAGLRAGDVLLSVAGKPVADGADLAQELRRRAPGETVALGLLRDGRRFEAAATLAGADVAQWRVESPSALEATRPESAAALLGFQAREIARLETLLRARSGDSDLAQLLRSGEAAQSASGEALRARLEALRREKAALEARVSRSASASVPPPAPAPTSPPLAHAPPAASTPRNLPLPPPAPPPPR